MQRVHEVLNEYLDDLVRPDSSIAFIVNTSRKLSCTKDPKTVAVIVTLNVQGHNDGGMPFTDRKKLGPSIAEGVKNYVVTIKDRILAQFTDVTEIK